MVGHRLGEFSPTRKFKAHGGKLAREVGAAAPPSGGAPGAPAVAGAPVAATTPAAAQTPKK